MREVKLLVWTLIFILLYHGGHAEAGEDPNFIIIPGVAVGKVRIGDKKWPMLSEGLEVEKTGDGTLQKIKVSGGRYSVQYNHVRVGDALQKIFRFYEPITKEMKEKDVMVIRAPRQGIEFSVDMKKEIITEISIFEPNVPDFYRRRTQQRKNVEQKSDTQNQESLKKYYQDVLKK